MTTTYDLPAHVAANIARRQAADTRNRHCTYGCTSPTHLYPQGNRCDQHAPQPTNPTPDPTRTAAALSARRETLFSSQEATA